jgi:hypothetical protein
VRPDSGQAPPRPAAGTDEGLDLAQELLSGFASRTGLSRPEGAAGRYLWTDAFAVFALLGLYRARGDPAHLDWSLRLVDLVHNTLGRYRSDDPRSGWISGLDEEHGARRPTFGGLRIGKPLPERQLGEPYHDNLEWERDGQYFHYLTKWMHALDRVAVVTGDRQYLLWAIDLARVARRACVYREAGRLRMYWKMNVELTRPAVSTMGQLDPLDGYVTFTRLQATSRAMLGSTDSGLAAGQAELAAICRGMSWATSDALGIGGLLADGGLLASLMASGAARDDGLLEHALRDAEAGLAMLAARAPHAEPPEQRLAFRELGLSIGLQAIPQVRSAIRAAMSRFGSAASLLHRVATLEHFTPLGRRLEQTWRLPASRSSTLWAEHRDINDVMLAMSLVPAEYLLSEGYDAGGSASARRLRSLA